MCVCYIIRTWCHCPLFFMLLFIAAAHVIAVVKADTRHGARDIQYILT